jgi:hypothetical protein
MEILELQKNGTKSSSRIAKLAATSLAHRQLILDRAAEIKAIGDQEEADILARRDARKI